MKQRNTISLFLVLNLFLVLFICLSAKTFAQQIKLNGKVVTKQEFESEISKANKAFNDSYDKLFEGLNSKYIETGLLLDKLLFTSNEISSFENIAANKIDATYWRKIYNLLHKMQLNNKGSEILSMPIIESFIEEKNSRNLIPIGIIDIEYNKFKEDAIKSQIIEVYKHAYVDHSNEAKSAYAKSNLFLASPLISNSTDLAVEFVVAEEFYLKNDYNSYKSIEIDFDDGNGFRKVDFNNSIRVMYSSSGEKNLRIRLEDSKGNMEISVSKFTVIGKLIAENGKTGYQDPDYIKTLSNGSRAYIEYGCDNNNQLKRPFVFVEGLNFSPPSGCPENNLRFGTFGWDVFRSGQDLSCQADPLNIPYLPDLVEKLKSEGFDIILLDFKDGAGSIGTNANVLIELINWLKTQLNNNNSEHKLVVAGASMGGVVSRYALSKMEQTNQDHHTRLYLSLDAPHNGANIPIGDQYLLSFFSGFDRITDEKPEILEALGKINKMAPKQLVNYHHASGVSSTWHQSLINHAYYQFPTETYNIGIANGSGNATNQGFSPGAKMVDIDDKTYKLGILVARIQGEPFAVHNGNGKFFWGKVYILPNITEVEYSATTKPFDSAPGATRNTNYELGQSSAIYPHHCFIPTISALSLNTTNLYYNVSTSSLMNNYPFVRAANQSFCPFDMIYVQNANQDHVETTYSNVNWITDKTAPENMKLQNMNLDGVYEARSTIVAGENIYSGSASPNTGMVKVLSSDDVEMLADNSITLKTGFKVYPGAGFKVALNTSCPEYNFNPKKDNGLVGNAANAEKPENAIFEMIVNEELTAEANSRISIYPNPNNGTFTVLNENSICAVESIEVMNYMGQQVYSNFEIAEETHQIDISNQPNGVYFVKIKSGNEVITQKIIKK